MLLDELIDGLKSEGMVVKSTNSKTIEFTRPDIPYSVYVKAEIKPKQRIETKLLVIHSAYLQNEDVIRRIPGVRIGTADGKWTESLYYHDSTMRSLLSRKHTGEKEIKYGVHANVANHRALKDLLRFLAGEIVHSFADELEISEGQLSALDQTQRKAIINARVGQGIFRDRLIDYWKSCAVLNISETIALRASHIKPWCDSTNFERLDYYNGLLLTPALDHFFDRGLISFEDGGELVRSKAVDAQLFSTMGIQLAAKLRQVDARHLPYLDWHRTHVLRK